MTNVTPEYVAEIIEKFEVSDEQRGVMGIEGNFLPFLFPLLCYLGLIHPSSFPLSVAVMAKH